jgi:predicted transposase YbfD/YdcC
MAKGFAPGLKTEKKAQPKLERQLTPIHEIQASLLTYVQDIPDPRVSRTQKHLLTDILVIAILAVIAGAQGWEDMENYGLSKQPWLSEFLELPNGIPSDDTFRRVFERIKPEALEQLLSQWLQHLSGSFVGEIVPIDGKNLKGSYDRNQGVKALHLVTAWASEQKLVLGQVKVESKSNEITAIPALLELLDLQGAIITIDAMGTQTEIVKQIQHQKADYIVALKANHPTLHAQVKSWFEQAQTSNFEGIEFSYDYHLEKGHHRLEKRWCWAVPLATFGGLYQQHQWSGLQSIVMVKRVRRLWNKTTCEVQFYLSSLPADAQIIGNAIRKHWGIENQVHWTLDVTFNEDKCRIRSFHSPRNFALLRRVALNALNQESTYRRSLRQKSKRAAMDNNYMMAVLSSFCQA